MRNRFLVDTNVLVYAYDRSEPKKQKIALDILDHLVRTQVGVLSTQILAEFFWIVSRRIPAPLSIEDASKQVNLFVQSWPVLSITHLIVIEATRGVMVHHLSYWDAQVWATARLNQVPMVLSEDFNDGSTIEGIRFANPFVKGFKLPMFQI